MTERTAPNSLVFVAAGLLIAYSPSYIGPLLGWMGVNIGPSGPQSILLWNWLAVGTLVAYILFVERKRLASILLIRPKGKDIEWAFYFWGIGVGVSWLMLQLFPQSETYSSGVDAIITLPIVVVIGIIFTTAISEEILFKGYPIERLRELTGKLWVGVLVSFALFITPHLLFFGPEWLLYNGIATGLIYVLYVWRRNLYACILLHFLSNAPILIPALGLGG